MLISQNEKFTPHNMTIQKYFEDYVRKKKTPDTPLSQVHYMFEL